MVHCGHVEPRHHQQDHPQQYGRGVDDTANSGGGGIGEEVARSLPLTPCKQQERAHRSKNAVATMHDDHAPVDINNKLDTNSMPLKTIREADEYNAPSIENTSGTPILQ